MTIPSIIAGKSLGFGESKVTEISLPKEAWVSPRSTGRVKNPAAA
jgi:hypothetical protein